MQLMDKLMKGPQGLFYKDETIRLIGVGASNLDNGEYRQMSLFDVMPASGQSNVSASSGSNLTRPVISNEKREKLDAMTDLIKKEFGKNAIVRGSNLDNKK
jgi:DNA polymerase-4